MKKVKRLLAVLAVVLALVSGAVTVYAVSADGERTPVKEAAATADYAAEEMAVGDYYADWVPEV